MSIDGGSARHHTRLGGGKRMVVGRGSCMLQAGPEVTSAAGIVVKDPGLVLRAGRDREAALALATTALPMFAGALGATTGARDGSQAIRKCRLPDGGRGTG